VIVLDAYPVIAYLTGEPVAADVAAILRTDERALTSLGVAEVIDFLVRRHGADADGVVLDLAELDLLEPDPLSASVARDAALLRAKHCGKHRQVSLADCVAAQTARARHGSVATSDPHLLDLCHDEGIDVRVLADSTGHRWVPTSP